MPLAQIATSRRTGSAGRRNPGRGRTGGNHQQKRTQIEIPISCRMKKAAHAAFFLNSASSKVKSSALLLTASFSSSITDDLPRASGRFSIQHQETSGKISISSIQGADVLPMFVTAKRIRHLRAYKSNRLKRLPSATSIFPSKKTGQIILLIKTTTIVQKEILHTLY